MQSSVNVSCELHDFHSKTETINSYSMYLEFHLLRLTCLCWKVTELGYSNSQSWITFAMKNIGIAEDCLQQLPSLIQVHFTSMWWFSKLVVNLRSARNAHCLCQGELEYQQTSEKSMSEIFQHQTEVETSVWLGRRCMENLSRGATNTEASLEESLRPSLWGRVRSMFHVKTKFLPVHFL